MTNDPDLARAVRSWLDEGADRLPDRVLDAVLASVPTTRQRRAWCDHVASAGRVCPASLGFLQAPA